MRRPNLSNLPLYLTVTCAAVPLVVLSGCGSDSAPASSDQSDPCSNQVQDGDETDVDCGGDRCPSCALGKLCSQDSDCGSDYCLTDHCTEHFGLRANGGVGSDTTFDGKKFEPLLGFLTKGDAHDSTEALDKDFAIKVTPFLQ